MLSLGFTGAVGADDATSVLRGRFEALESQRHLLRLAREAARAEFALLGSSATHLVLNLTSGALAARSGHVTVAACTVRVSDPEAALGIQSALTSVDTVEVVALPAPQGRIPGLPPLSPVSVAVTVRLANGWRLQSPMPDAPHPSTPPVLTTAAMSALITLGHAVARGTPVILKP